MPYSNILCTVHEKFIMRMTAWTHALGVTAKSLQPSATNIVQYNSNNSRNVHGWWAWSTKKSSPLGIIHGHLVRHKQVFRVIQNVTNKFLWNFNLANFILPHSLTHSATATAFLLWWKCLEFCGEKKPFTILNAYAYALSSYKF